MGKTNAKNYNNHTLVPKHEKITEKQKQELLKEHNCTETELPKIKISDSAISDMNPKIGEIFRITRKNKSEGATVFYRVVIDE